MYIKLRTNSTISIHKLPLTIGSHASIIIKKPSIKPIHFKLTSNSHTIYGSDCQFDGRIIKIKGITIEIVEYISKNDINRSKDIKPNVLRNEDLEKDVEDVENVLKNDLETNVLRNDCENDLKTNVLRNDLSLENATNIKDTKVINDHVILKDESMIIDCYGNVTVFEKSVDSKENEWISTSSIIDITKEPKSNNTKNDSEECKKRRIDSTGCVNDNSIKDASESISHNCITNIYNTHKNTNPNPNPSNTNNCNENVNEECIDTKNELQSMHEISKEELQDNLQNINTTQSSCIQENKMHPTENSIIPNFVHTTDNPLTTDNLDAPNFLHTRDSLHTPDDLYPNDNVHTPDLHPSHNINFHDNGISNDNSLLYSNFQTNTPIFTDQSQNTPVKEIVLYTNSQSSFMKDKKLKRSVQRLKTKDNQGIEEYPIERKAIDLKEVTVPVDENGNECSSSYVSVGEGRVMKRGSLNEKVNDTYIKNNSKKGENEKIVVKVRMIVKV